VRFDSSRTASLDGVWELFPGDERLEDLDGQGVAIEVPGLWEAQGWLDLDGVAWYRRRFSLDDVSGGWTLRFGAVMDFAEVWLNRTLLGRHDLAFTPFELDPSGALVNGVNELAVRVTDPALADPEHRRTAHGKQGWANHVFPSRPSLYMTYGGIWQTVTLRRHGSLVIDDVFVNGDPEDLTVVITVTNRGEHAEATLGVRTLGMAGDFAFGLAPRATVAVRARFGPTSAPGWTPEEPVLHDVLVDLRCGGVFSDSHTSRYGLRRVRVEGREITIDGRPYRMRSALVQGFRADTLYAEGSREDIRREVMAARDMGFNTLRLHIKAFDPTYLDVCDEIGMLLHCDIPVAEPIVHEEMGDDTVLGRRCVAAARAQVRRDRNHPSIVLWSAMNEICDGRPEARRWPEYESFVRAVAQAVMHRAGPNEQESVLGAEGT
jgi:beta-galactosidase/beta-glucuronidase